MLGVIAAGDPNTVEAGATMLRKGGNAVDAAIAAAFASFVAEVGVVHLGGSGVAQVWIPNGDKDVSSLAYDFFSDMPGRGRDTAVEKLDFEQVTVDFGPTTQDFFLGRGSVAVPGNIFGLCRIAREHGRLDLATLLEPAINLAREGLAISPFQAETCDLLRVLYTHTSEMQRIFARGGHIIRPGERLFIPNLTETLNRLATEGEDYARTGALAKAIVTDQIRNGGLLTDIDLKEYKVLQLSPIRVPYREFEILLPPPSSTGGVLTAFTLSLLSHFDLAQYQHGSSEHLRLLFEVMAATTRARPIWDKIVDELPVNEAIDYFLAKGFVAHYAIEVQKAISGNRHYPILSEPSFHPDTSHISVLDGQGMAVSLTTTAGESAGYVVPETGYIPNNILGEADLHPGGFHMRPPGQRIPTMMTPTFVLFNNKIRLVVGSGGSIRIRSAILQVLSNLLDFKMKLNDAVNTARVHLENGMLQCELGYDMAAVEQFESLGYSVNRWDRRSIYFGGAHSVSRTIEGQLVAAGDNRRGGSITVVE